MLFNSFSFVLLVIITFALFYHHKLQKFQIYILIFASFIFYAYAQPILLALLLFSASINAFTSYIVYFESSLRKKKRYAIGGVIFNLFILALFKYSPLFGHMINGWSQYDDIGEILIMVPLPVGISFYTFQGISLVMDLYRSRHQKECPLFPVNKNFFHHYRETVFFIVFFPQLVAGPIVKAYQFYPQIMTKYLKDINFTFVYKTLVLGYFLKMVIADNLKDQTFWMTYPYFEALSSLTLVFLLIGYSVQIFADFAGYSLIAIGIAALFGYELPQNFNYPYIAKSFSEFWTRWHISLSSWLKEYLYFSLGGNKKGQFRTYINLMVVMTLGGLWHGAAWSYAVWGIYHGVLLIVERMIASYFTPSDNGVISLIRVVLVFLFVTLGWLLFKLEFGDAVNYLRAILYNGSAPHNKFVIMNIFFFVMPVVIYYVHYVFKSRLQFISHKLEAFIYACMVFGIIFQSGSPGAFIYFQF